MARPHPSPPDGPAHQAHTEEPTVETPGRPAAMARPTAGSLPAEHATVAGMPPYSCWHDPLNEKDAT
jgi:hypothetical protein